MSRRCLIVDDSELTRVMLRDICAGSGRYSVAGEAANGAEAVKLYRELKPDLVTMDIVMPELSGIEAVRLITQADPKARIIMCSAMGQQNLVIEAIQAGARDFVIKPFQAARVLQASERALEG